MPDAHLSLVQDKDGPLDEESMRFIEQVALAARRQDGAQLQALGSELRAILQRCAQLERRVVELERKLSESPRARGYTLKDLVVLSLLGIALVATGWLAGRR